MLPPFYIGRRIRDVKILESGIRHKTSQIRNTDNKNVERKITV
jgi:hypothetical protein